MKRRSQVCVSLLNPYLAQAEASGLAREQLLRELGLTENMFGQAMRRMAFKDFLKAVHKLIALTNSPEMGLMSGEYFHPSTLGPLSYLMMNSPTIGEAYGSFLSYEKLINEVVQTNLYVEDGLVYNSETYKGFSDEAVAPLIESDFSSMKGYTQFLSFRANFDKPVPKKVCFRHQPQTDVEKYEAAYGAPVKFGQDKNTIVFDAEIMNYKIPGADARIVARAVAELDAIQAELKGERRFSSDVYDFIKEGFYGELPSASEAAKYFAMSVSTFQRRLREESNTFKELVEQVRKDKAEVFLGDVRFSIAEVATRLGFSDTPAFFKAFKRWTGKTPAEYRKTILEQKDGEE